MSIGEARARLQMTTNGRREKIAKTAPVPSCLNHPSEGPDTRLEVKVLQMGLRAHCFDPFGAGVRGDENRAHQDDTNERTANRGGLKPHLLFKNIRSLSSPRKNTAIGPKPTAPKWSAILPGARTNTLRPRGIPSFIPYMPRDIDTPYIQKYTPTDQPVDMYTHTHV